ncbi:DUF58 domain-containing protein [Virgibacillus doumboii]|uniref:DUF58 domain-containing protein n=1 Tax=Virgibacillus doumboii TaxID=2697503 RepID=UPI0013DF65B8|nr:DUF58 domain-containing protein [Virgibacillus doumboii]
MQWKKELTSEKKLEHEIILALIILMAVASLYLDRALAFLFIGIISVYLLGLYLYNRHVGRNLILTMPNQSIRAFPDESMDLKLTIKNNSLIPYLNGYLSLSVKNHIINEDYLYIAGREENEYRIPVSLPGKSKIAVTIPFKALSRGAGRIKQIHFSFPNLLNFEKFTLDYTVYHNVEMIVYPILQAVKSAEEVTSLNFGEDFAINSPFEDRLQPLGTRDYVTSDPFRRIHWKASAKMQTLQTKTYERNRYIAWSIVVNISKKSRLGNTYINPELEELLSKTAYICRSLIEMGNQVEIYVNENGPVHLPDGRNINHLKKILSLLTRIENRFVVYPFTNMLYQLQQSHFQPRMMIFVGEHDENHNYYIEKLLSQGHRIFHVDDSYINPIAKGKDLYG